MTKLQLLLSSSLCILAVGLTIGPAPASAAPPVPAPAAESVQAETSLDSSSYAAPELDGAATMACDDACHAEFFSCLFGGGGYWCDLELEACLQSC